MLSILIFIVTIACTYTGKKFVPYNACGRDMNRGELVEIAYKSALGLPAEKDASTPFDAGDDIPVISASVKSEGFTLVNRPLGDTKEDVLNAYFEHVHSKRFDYITTFDNFHTITVYSMDKTKFREFLEMFGTFDSKRKVIRVKHETSKLIKWLKDNSPA